MEMKPKNVKSHSNSAKQLGVFKRLIPQDFASITDYYYRPRLRSDRMIDLVTFFCLSVCLSVCLFVLCRMNCFGGSGLPSAAKSDTAFCQLRAPPLIRTPLVWGNQMLSVMAKIDIVSLIFVRFSIRNHQWKAEDLSSPPQSIRLDLARE